MTLDYAAYPVTNRATNNGGPPDGRSRQALNDGYKEAPLYVQERGLGFYFRDLARRGPWLAIATTFAIGYFTARLIRRAS